jgi:hypothetical protein
MLAREETPLERIEADIARLQALPDIVMECARPRGLDHLGPWAGLHEHMKYLLLSYLDWSGVPAGEWQRITAREVKPYDFWDCFRRKGGECD